MKSKSYRDILEHATSHKLRDNIDLTARIMTQVQRKTFMQTLRAHPALSLLILVLTLSILTGVAYAIGRPLGFIPGYGLVDESWTVRLMEEPVSATQGPFTVTITRLIADSRQIVLDYEVKGVHLNRGMPNICDRVPTLRLNDGTILTFKGGGSASIEKENGITSPFKVNHLIYPGLNADADKITFILPCILPEPRTGPENWEIQIPLVRAPDDFVIPAIEIETRTLGPEVTQTTTDSDKPQASYETTSTTPYIPRDLDMVKNPDFSDTQYPNPG